jgi:hypothetical protein
VSNPVQREFGCLEASILLLGMAVDNFITCSLRRNGKIGFVFAGDSLMRFQCIWEIE